MTVFWIVAACLVLAALLFVVPPMFRRESSEELGRREVNISIYKNQLSELEEDLAAGDVTQEHYDKSRQEIERRLLEDAAIADKAARSSKGLSTVSAVVVSLAVPAVAIGLYMDIGNIDAIDPANRAQPSMAAQSPHGDADMSNSDMQAQIEMMVGRLAQRLQDDPSDIEGWVMLGRSMTVLGRYNEAVQAYENALQIVGEDANVLADYADAVAMASGESLEGKPMELLQRALELDPNNQKALWLGGTGLFESGDFEGAINYWSRLKDLLPAGSDDIEVMRANIAEAESYRQRQLAGEFGEVPSSGANLPAAETAPAVASRVTGRVSISAELFDQAAADDILFVYARAAQGPAMPLAIVRATAAELPLEFSLDESMAMMPNMSLASFDQVIVGARISKTGNAMPQSGDLQGMTDVIAVGTEGLDIVINSQVP